MKKRYFVYASLAVLLIVALLTNLSLERQKQIIKTEIVSFLEKEFSKETGDYSGSVFANIAVNLGRTFAGSLIEPLVDKAIESDNYLLFSIPYVLWGEEKKIIGVAAFNRIFFFKNLDDIKAELLKTI